MFPVFRSIHPFFFSLYNSLNSLSRQISSLAESIHRIALSILLVPLRLFEVGKSFLFRFSYFAAPIDSKKACVPKEEPSLPAPPSIEQINRALRGKFSESLWLLCQQNPNLALFPTSRQIGEKRQASEIAEFFLRRVAEVEDLLINVESVCPKGTLAIKNLIEGDQTPQHMGVKAIYSGLLSSQAIYTEELHMELFHPVRKEEVVYVREICVDPYSKEPFTRTFEKIEEVSDLEKNQFYYLGAWGTHLSALQGEMLEAERSDIEPIIERCFNQFCSLLTESGPLDSRQSQMRDIQEALREYLGTRKQMSIRGRNDGTMSVTDDLIKLHPSIFNSELYVSFDFRQSEEGIWLGKDLEGNEYVGIGGHAYKKRHFFNYYFDFKTKQFIKFDNLQAKSRSPEEARCVNWIAIPLEEYEKHKHEFEELDVLSWALPPQLNNNCFFAAALMDLAVMRLYRRLIEEPKT